MSNDPTPYEIAKLAALIDPEKCRRESTRNDAIKLAMELVGSAEDQIKYMARRREILKTAIEKQNGVADFVETHGITGDGNPIERAAIAVTGRTDRNTKKALIDFEKVVRARAVQEPGSFNANEILQRFRADGVPMLSIVHFREFAEKTNLTKKKLLTADLRQEAAIDAADKKEAAAKSKKLRQLTENLRRNAPSSAAIAVQHWLLKWSQFDHTYANQ